MVKEKIEYTDFDGNKRTEEHWFHLMESEIAEMELTTVGGLSAKIQRIIDAQDMPEIVKMFKELLLASYGIKSPDGRSFVKFDDNGRRLSDSFKQTAAYSALFMKFAQDDVAAAHFINGIIPGNKQNNPIPAPPIK